MRAGISGGWVFPLVMASLTACGGEDVGDGSFGGNSSGGNGGTGGATTSSTTVGSSTQQSAAGTGGAGPGSGGSGSGGSADGGGGSSSAQGGGGSSSQGGGGGAAPAACDDGCTPSADAGADCDDDGDLNATDCQPCDALVHAAQEELFDAPYASFDGGGPSFDYDCSGAAEVEYPFSPDGCSAFTAQTCPDEGSIYSGSEAPVCGESQVVQDCQVTGAVAGVAGTCAAQGGASTMLVRCR